MSERVKNGLKRSKMVNVAKTVKCGQKFVKNSQKKVKRIRESKKVLNSQQTVSELPMSS